MYGGGSAAETNTEKNFLSLVFEVLWLVTGKVNGQKNPLIYLVFIIVNYVSRK
jgi:hypothetical protein